MIKTHYFIWENTNIGVTYAAVKSLKMMAFIGSTYCEKNLEGLSLIISGTAEKIIYTVL